MKKQILVADDSPEVRKMLCTLFSNHDALEICHQAVSGKEAVKMAERFRPHLIILDLSMPEMNGIEAAKAISKILPDVPIILFTLYAHVIREEDVAGAGIHRVVSKAEPAKLLTQAEKLLKVA